MLETVLLIISPFIGAILWSFPSASILQWRARKLESWTIKYKDAYLIAVKAALIAAFLADLVIFSLVFAGFSDEKVLKPVASLVGLGSWWIAHTNGLLKLAGPSNLIPVKRARAISASVFGYLFVTLLGIGIGFVLIFLAASAFFK